MKSLLCKLGLFGLCAVMTGWLIRYEAFPGLFADDFVGYSNLFEGGTLLSDRYNKILFDGNPIGYSHSRMNSHEKDLTAAYSLDNSTYLHMKVLGQTQTVRVQVKATLDSTYLLQTFSFGMQSSQYRAQISGERQHGDTFKVEIDTGAMKSETHVDIPDDVILYSPMTDLALSRLEAGKELRIRTLDPVSMTQVDVVCRALGEEKVMVGSEERDAMALTMSYKGMEVKSWLDDEGHVLRQDTPLGWTMVASSADEISALILDPEGSSDVALATVVTCDGTIERPRECRTLKLRLHGLNLNPDQLRTARQDVRVLRDTEVEVVLRNAPLPESSPRFGELSTDLQPYVQATPFVQSDHPEMIAQAKRVVGPNATMLEAAKALCEWVDKAVVNEPTASLPSALDVLHHKVGDCNEHTYLYVGLARAIGLPAKIRIGVVYMEDERGKGFFYHAWPAVHVGDGWYDMDPTLQQQTADATHISLLEGELENQMQLLQVIGQLSAKVVDQVY